MACKSSHTAVLSVIFVWFFLQNQLYFLRNAFPMGHLEVKQYTGKAEEMNRREAKLESVPSLWPQRLLIIIIQHGCESRTIKKAEHWIIDTFKFWCWRRLLRVPWTPQRWNQSVLKETNPEYSLEGLILKLQYFGHLMWRASSLENTVMLGKIEGKRRRGQQRMRWLESNTDSMDMSLCKLLR